MNAYTVPVLNVYLEIGLSLSIAFNKLNPVGNLWIFLTDNYPYVITIYWKSFWVGDFASVLKASLPLEVWLYQSSGPAQSWPDLFFIFFLLFSMPFLEWD